MDPNNLSIDDLVDYAPSHCFGEEFPLVWQMTRAERFGFLHIVKQFKPELSIEIGTFKGGSLQVLSRYSQEVVSIDIDQDVEQTLTGSFPNVVFRSGDSSVVLPQVVEEINRSGKHAGIVLIDGDHTERGVRRDINAILQLRPKRPIGIIMHDSFNPLCRTGIKTADWVECPYIHYVEIDFIGGIFVPGRTDADTSMVSGLAFALMLPEKRNGKLKIIESQCHTFEIVNRFAAKSKFLDQSLRSRFARLLKLVKKG